jgi:type IV pilus assembly protein PilX
MIRSRSARQRPLPARRQEGVALFIALVVLLIITILGVSGLQTTTLEERMAAAARDRDIAFQAAEAALSQAEQFIETLGPGDLAQFQNNADGLYVPPGDAVSGERWETVDWNGGNAITVATAVPGQVAAQPRYIVEHVTTLVADEDTLNLSNIGQSVGAPTEIFRITALGTGGSERARVLLQATYGRVL